VAAVSTHRFAGIDLAGGTADLRGAPGEAVTLLVASGYPDALSCAAVEAVIGGDGTASVDFAQ